MAKSKLSFLDYILNYNTENTFLFINEFKDYIKNIPSETYSSRIIYSILNSELETIRNNDVKRKIFRETFNEYFKFKVLNDF